MDDRYAETLGRLAARGEGAFVPFCVLGDPDAEASLNIVRELARAGADALELGIPFSDPVADGPTIQAADLRALRAGIRPRQAFAMIRQVRQEFVDLPLGLLVYANLVVARGAETFYGAAADAGVDSVLVADVPTLEAPPFVEAATRQGILPVLIATVSCHRRHLEQVARMTRGYTYVVTRSGVTGVDDGACTDHRRLITELRGLGAAPPLLGFGISRPGQVRQAMAAGAAGAISGSAVVRIVEQHHREPSTMLRRLGEFVAAMKGATVG